MQARLLGRQRLGRLPARRNSIRHSPAASHLQLLRRAFITSIAEAWNNIPTPSDGSDMDDSPAGRVRYISSGIHYAAQGGQLVHVLKLCGLLKQACKEANQKPDIAVFHSLLQVFAQYGYFEQGLHTLQDMLHSGIAPTLETFNLVLSCATTPEDNLSPIFEAMRISNLEPDPRTRHQLIRIQSAVSNLEAALLQLDKIEMAGQQPLLESLNTLALLALEQGEVRLAYDLLNKAEKDQESDVFVPTQTWFQLLEAAAEAYFLPALLEGVNRLQYSDFTEGLLLNMLNVAGRHGSTQLAEQCLDILKEHSSRSFLTLTLREWHYAPLIEAYTRAGRLDRAVEVVNELVQLAEHPNAGDELGPQLHTVLPLKDAFIQRSRPREVREDESVTDQTAQSIPISPVEELRQIHQRGIPIHASVFNAALLSQVETDQIHQALIDFKQSQDTFSVSPNADTFNILLLGCIKTGHLVLGRQLMRELQSKQILPDQTTYERMIQLCVQEDENLDEAFGYLEALKSFGATPSIDVYRSFLHRLREDEDARSTDIRLEAESHYGEALASSARRIARGTETKKPKKPRRKRALAV